MLVESGLYLFDKSLVKLFYFTFFNIYRPNNSTRLSIEVKVASIKLEDAFKGVFSVLILGLIVSIISFILEKMYFASKNKLQN